MAHAEYKVFPTHLHLIKFFGQYLPKLDVLTSARMPPFMYSYDGKIYTKRGLYPWLLDMEEYANLGIDAAASTHRGTHFIIFFNKPLREPIKTEEDEEVNTPIIGGIDNKPDVSEHELVTQAKALYNDSDKKASKVALEAFAADQGVSLNKGKTFEAMVDDFGVALAEKTD